jgi:5'-methylthioadenosine phosphorylase
MTGYPEFALAREAGICYLPCSFVTDYDCWKDDEQHVTLQMVMDIMRKNNAKAFQLLQKIIPQNIALDPASREGGLRQGLMTPREAIPTKIREWLDILLS